MEENTVPAENVDVAEDSIVTAPPADEPNTSEPQETDGDAEQEQVNAPAADDTESSERKPSRAEKRIRDLSQRLKQYEEQPNQQPRFMQAPQPMFEDGREYTAAELEQRMVQRANDIAQIQTQAQLDRYKAEVNLDHDIEVIPTKFPELDDKSDDFTPELVESIEEEFKAKAYRNGVLDPSVRLSDIAARQVKAARAVAEKRAAAYKKAVDTSADEAAIKPSGETRQDKSIEDMTPEEIEAKYGIVYQ